MNLTSVQGDTELRPIDALARAELRVRSKVVPLHVEREMLGDEKGKDGNWTERGSSAS